jgi:phospholipase/lecithinase/hemolysin
MAKTTSCFPCALQTLYYNGAKNFWVHGTGPLGCLPQKLAEPRADDGDLDDSGCLRTLNAGSYEFNSQLCSICDKLTAQLRGATIVYTDLLSIKYDLVANHSSYGFEEPLMACCGYGGPPYNYNANVSCLGPGYRVCEDGSKFVSWDGVHYTDAANALVAAKILSAEFSTPKVPFSYFCKS